MPVAFLVANNTFSMKTEINGSLRSLRKMPKLASLYVEYVTALIFSDLGRLASCLVSLRLDLSAIPQSA